MPSKNVQVNMRLLRKSRPILRPGDVFTYLMPDQLFRFGRVIRTDASIGGFPNCVLLYFYEATSRSKDNIPILDKSDLLIPPVATNRQGWLRGFFETLVNRSLTPEEVFDPHCFWSPIQEWCFDADGHKLQTRFEPCGDYGVHSYRTIDDEISKALGIPLAPD
jgi:Immunity protein 26